MFCGREWILIGIESESPALVTIPACDWSMRQMLACDWLLLTRRLVSPWSGRGRVSLCVTNLVSCLLTSLIISHEKLWEWKHFSKISDSKTNQS